MRTSINNALWRLAQTASKGLASLYFLFIAAKYMSPVDFGILNYLIAVIGLCLLFSDFGFSTATSKYVAELSTCNPERSASVLPSVLVLVGSINLALSVVVIAGFFIAKSTYFPTIAILVPSLFFISFSNILDGYLRGRKRFNKLAQIYVASSLLFVLPAFLLVRHRPALGSALAYSLLYLLPWSSCCSPFASVQLAGSTSETSSRSRAMLHSSGLRTWRSSCTPGSTSSFLNSLATLLKSDTTAS